MRSGAPGGTRSPAFPSLCNPSDSSTYPPGPRKPPALLSRPTAAFLTRFLGTPSPSPAPRPPGHPPVAWPGVCELILHSTCPQGLRSGCQGDTWEGQVKNRRLSHLPLAITLREVSSPPAYFWGVQTHPLTGNSTDIPQAGRHAGTEHLQPHLGTQVCGSRPGSHRDTSKRTSEGTHI